MCQTIPPCYDSYSGLQNREYTNATYAIREVRSFLAVNPKANYEDLKDHLIEEGIWAWGAFRELVERRLDRLEKTGESPKEQEEYRKILSLLPK